MCLRSICRRVYNLRKCTVEHALLKTGFFVLSLTVYSPESFNGDRGVVTTAEILLFEKIRQKTKTVFFLYVSILLNTTVTPLKRHSHPRPSFYVLVNYTVNFKVSAGFPKLSNLLSHTYPNIFFFIQYWHVCSCLDLAQCFIYTYNLL